MQLSSSLDPEQLPAGTLDQVPYGVVRLGADGIVEHMNRAEAERLGIQRWRALGRDYFHDVIGASARPLAEAAATLARGARTALRLQLAGFRWNREGQTVLVQLHRTMQGKLLLCLYPAGTAPSPA